MTDGWNCPRCGKAHGPHVNTCPEQFEYAPPEPGEAGCKPNGYQTPPITWPTPTVTFDHLQATEPEKWQLTCFSPPLPVAR